MPSCMGETTKVVLASAAVADASFLIRLSDASSDIKLFSIHINITKKGRNEVYDV